MFDTFKRYPALVDSYRPIEISRTTFCLNEPIGTFVFLWASELMVDNINEGTLETSALEYR
jgi:hypothetical protein